MKLALLVGVILTAVVVWGVVIGENSVAALDCDELDEPCEVVSLTKNIPVQLYGQTTLTNPAVGQTLQGTLDDPLAGFSRRPMNKFIIPAGGAFLDPLHDGPHYGVDYANPDDYLNGKATHFYPIGPGFVTTRSTCVMCFVDGEWQGRVNDRQPQHNFGWGTLVITETPYNEDVSIYVMYAHLNRDMVSLGDYVTPKDIIGIVGTSGYSEEIHLHVEIRYGAPGRFWNADFTRYETLDRWLATMFVNPAWVIFPENHSLLGEALREYVASQPQESEMP